MKAALAAVLSLVLATAPAAQAQVVSGRAVALPAGGIALPVSPTLQLSGPTLTLTAPLAPALSPSLAAPVISIAPAALIPARLPATVQPLKVVAESVPAALKPVALAPMGAEPGDELGALHNLNLRGEELKAAFDEKKAEDVPVDGAAAPEPGANLSPRTDVPAARTPNEPPKPPSGGGRTFFGFTRPLAFFLLALVLAQVGIEAQTAGLPPLIAKIFGNVSVAADMGIAAYAADAVGTVLAPIVSRKLGLKKGYVWSTGLRVITSGLIAGLLATGWIGLAGFTALLVVDNVLYGVSYTLEKSIPAVMVNQDQAKLEKFKAWRQTAIESVATVIPIATGLVVASLGFVPALVAFPVAMATAMLVVSLTLQLPKKLAGANAAPLPVARTGTVKGYVRHLGQGIATVWKSKTLLTSLLAYSLVYAPTPIIYWFLAPAFGLHFAGTAAGATAYAGMMTGLYSLGSIAGALLMVRQQRKAQDAAAMRKSMLRWAAVTGVVMAAFGALALPFAGWGVLTLPALALMLFGVPQIVAKLKLESFFQSQAPKGAVDDATSVLECASSLTIIAGLWWFGKMLAGAHVTSAVWLTAAAAPLALGLLALVWLLARASRPSGGAVPRLTAKPAGPSRPGLIKRLWASPVAGVAASLIGAAGFAVGVWHFMGVARMQEFVSTYLIEWTLSLDNLVVLSTVLHALPEKIRPKVLSWGIVGAVLMRMGMVSAGMGLAAASPMVFVVFGAFLLTVAAKMFKPEWDLIGLAFSKTKAAFASKEPKVAKERKGFFANPFVWGLLAVIGYDAVFALDSVPVALAISSSVFIIVAANIFSVLGLRSLFSILHKLEEKFPNLQKGVAFVLVFVALKMIAGPLLGFHVGSLASLLVVLSFLGISMLIPAKKR